MTAVTVLLAVITLCMLVFAVLGVLLYKKISQLLTTTERSVSLAGLMKLVLMLITGIASSRRLRDRGEPVRVDMQVEHGISDLEKAAVPVPKNLWGSLGHAQTIFATSSFQSPASPPPGSRPAQMASTSAP